MKYKITTVLISIILLINGCSTKSSMAKSSLSSSEARYDSTYIDGDSKILTYIGTAILFGIVYSVALKNSYKDEQQ
jgi:uncharacterized protein YceK